MQNYSASILYEKETIKNLDAVIEATFHYSRKLMILLFGLFILIGGFVIGIGSVAGNTCIIMGCVILPSANTMQSRNARQIIKVMNDRTLFMSYTFLEDSFICSVGNECNEFSYHSIIRLVEDKGFLYLFQKTTQACMIDIKSIEPNELDKFKQFISKRVKLEWTKKTTLFTVSVKKHKFDQKNTRIQ